MSWLVQNGSQKEGTMVTAAARDFSHICRQWRQFRKLSQLDLALAANVSQRHVSWMETGRSTPSRDMVMRLADAMEIPLRERNLLLQAAGYSAAYSESQLDEPVMAPVLAALERILSHHEPLPAAVVDRFWNVTMKNKAADLLLGLGGDVREMMKTSGGGEEINLAWLTVHPQGLRRFITNWEQAAPAFVRRLRSEARSARDPALQARFQALIDLSGVAGDEQPGVENLLPVLPLEVSVGGLELSLFSVMSTIGTPQDITTDELRIEAFYPADDSTARFFDDMAASQEG
jgi:transcriptional regulator with XRE-family HTH domain